MKIVTYLKFFLFSCLLSASLAHAQLRVEVSGVGSIQVPIAIAGFANENIAPQKVTDIIRDDLTRSGYFKIIDTGVAISESSLVNFDEWKARGAEALVVGSVMQLSDGRYDVRYKLLDTIKSTTLSGLAIATVPQYSRVTAHKIADDIYEKLLGVKGIFSTRIAYVTKSGREYRLEVADADGEGAQTALRSKEPIMSPAWAPDGTRIAYVSFELKKPVVYVHNLMTGQRTVVANFKGNNSAPNWSPDGSKLAVTLTRDGLSQIYILNADGSGVRRITQSSGIIDTEAQFSPDGQNLYFTSDRSGGPQIYRMSVNGGEAKRLTFGSPYNVAPRISPDGNTLAFISRRNGNFQLYSMDLSNGQEQRLSDTNNDDNPSFAPNGKYLMYATESNRRGTLAIVSTDGRIKQKLTIQAGDIQGATWGPFFK
jgi:TolB protein